jgi:hypothetical protein
VLGIFTITGAGIRLVFRSYGAAKCSARFEALAIRCGKHAAVSAVLALQLTQPLQTVNLPILPIPLFRPFCLTVLMFLFYPSIKSATLIPSVSWRPDFAALTRMQNEG